MNMGDDHFLLLSDEPTSQQHSPVANSGLPITLDTYMSKFTKRNLIIGVIVGLACISFVVICLVSGYRSSDPIVPGSNICTGNFGKSCSLESGNFSHTFKNSTLGMFESAAVSTDGAPCAQIARKILLQNGSAIDATIAGLFCVGVINAQSMGLGGGFLATYYERSTGKAYSINTREMAPAAAYEDMYHGNATISKKGGLAVGVPGEVRGYYKMYQNWGGKLQWKDLIEPTIKLCEEGHNVNWHMARALFEKREDILAEPSLSVFVNKATGDIWKEGDIILRPQLAKTLRVLQRDPDALYTGTLAEGFVKDLNDFGSIITQQDLRNYKPVVKEATSISLSHGNLQLFSVPPPGSGLILGFILNILDEYRLTPESINNDNIVLTYHHIIEVFKWAYAKRTELGDADFVDIEELAHNLTSDAYAAYIKRLILNNQTFQDPTHYRAIAYSIEDSGTAQFTLLGPNGDAVSVTSTINLCLLSTLWEKEVETFAEVGLEHSIKGNFGAGIRSTHTGIILNNQMDDFSAPGFLNYFGMPPSTANYIRPGKRPLSSMCPAVIVDSAGDVRLVLGAVGGTKITSAVAWVALRNLWLGNNIKEAIDARRIHHQLFPMELQYEEGILESIVSGLEAMGHKSSKFPIGGSVVCGITQSEDGKIYANSDMRKAGEVAGF